MYLGLNLGWLYGVVLFFFSIGIMVTYQNCVAIKTLPPVP